MPNHDQDSSDNNRPENLKPISPDFMGIRLSGWAFFSVSLIVVLFTAGHFGLKLYDDLQDALRQKALSEEKVKQVAAVNADTSAYSNAVTMEMDRHKNDGSGHLTVLHETTSGKTYVTYFDSDGCIAIGRPGIPLPYLPAPQAILDWSLGPDRRPRSNPPHLTTRKTDIGVSALPDPPTIMKRSSPGASDETQARYKLPESAGTDSHFRLLRIQAGCWTNGAHPWPFRTSWGRANGCWAPLYRQWNDGCKHYQMFNACTGQWDPRVVWTFCNPQHHP